MDQAKTFSQSALSLTPRWVPILLLAFEVKEHEDSLMKWMQTMDEVYDSFVCPDPGMTS
jgi:hypothetical protein